MSEFKGTPGPYKIGEMRINKHGVVCHSIDTEDGHVECFAEVFEDPKLGISEYMATTKLIAASFDLYRELSNLVDKWNAGDIGLQDIENAEAALKKATA